MRFLCPNEKNDFHKKINTETHCTQMEVAIRTGIRVEEALSLFCERGDVPVGAALSFHLAGRTITVEVRFVVGLIKIRLAQNGGGMGD